MSRIRLTEKLASFGLASVIVTGVAMAVVHNLNLPTVAVNSEGQCQWVEYDTGAGIERRPCPMVMPNKYHLIYVKGN